MNEATKKNRNLGFTLIELIVSLTVASIVLLAIGTLMSVGTKSYQSTSNEIELQKESQIAMNQIHDLMIKAQDYVYQDVNVGGAFVPTLVITASEEGKLYYYAVIFDQARNQLLFQKNSKEEVELIFPSLEAWLRDQVTLELTSSTPSLLAKHIKALAIEPASLSVNTQGSVHITLLLSLGDKEYSTFSTTSLRNK